MSRRKQPGIGAGRSSGILLHPTSLAGPEGIGTLGPEAFAFVDFLQSAGQKLWQILPMGPSGYGDSPYQSYSSIAGNPLLIDLSALRRRGWLAGAHSALGRSSRATRTVDFRDVMRTKHAALRAAFEGFKARASGSERRAFAAFCRREAAWLDDYAFFVALKEHYGLRPWWKWPAGIGARQGRVLDPMCGRLAIAIERERFFQYLFFNQWDAVRQYANQRGIRIIGDIPLYVALDSADVWARPRNFLLDAKRRPRRVAGVPPDLFSRNGQLWGNPVYNWRYLRSTGFQWWVDRVARSLRMYDIVRMDHFRGLVGYWGVPYGKRTARDGKWYRAPGHELLSVLQARLGNIPMIAEDLGMITADVIRVQEAFNLPGMKILQYAFDGDSGSPHLPHNFDTHCAVYTGTHDNDTMCGWLKKAPAETKRRARRYAGAEAGEASWPFIRLAWASVAKLAIAPAQDLLELGSRARMNVPGTVGGRNWRWRMADSDLSPRLARRLRELTETYGR